MLDGHAAPALLDTYEPSAAPPTSRTRSARWRTRSTISTIAAASGVSPEQAEEQNLAALRRIWSGRPEDAEHRSTLLRHMRAQSMEFSELNVELGYRYESPAIVDDGSPLPDPVDPVRVYEPSTRPGAPLPHAWIDDEDGGRRAIKDLVGPGRFLLIAGEEGESWCEAARELAEEADLPLDALRIGHLDGDLYDPRCTWLRHRQIATDGAVLVRPDRFIGLAPPGRQRRAPGRPGGALSQILARPVGAPAASAA